MRSAQLHGWDHVFYFDFYLKSLPHHKTFTGAMKQLNHCLSKCESLRYDETGWNEFNQLTLNGFLGVVMTTA